MRTVEKIPTQSVIVQCARRILKIPTLCSLSSTLCPPIAFKDLPRRSMKIDTVVLTTLALLLILFPCVVTGDGGDGTPRADETEYLYYLIVK